MEESEGGEDQRTEGATRMSVERSNTILMRPVRDPTARLHREEIHFGNGQRRRSYFTHHPAHNTFDSGMMIRRGHGFRVHRLGGASYPARLLNRNEGECEESGDGRADGRLRLRARNRNAPGPTARGAG